MTTPGITVIGRGLVTVVPDVVRAELGVETTAPTVGAALDKASAQLAALRDALRAAGVQDADVRSAQSSTWSGQEGQGSETVDVAHAHLSMRVTLRSVADAGAWITTALAAAGEAGRLISMQVAVDDQPVSADEARTRAFGDAERKARQLADLAGRALGPVTSIHEDPIDGGLGPRAYAVAPMMSADMPIAAGSEDIVSNVVVAWSWAD